MLKLKPRRRPSEAYLFCRPCWLGTAQEETEEKSEKGPVGITMVVETAEMETFVVSFGPLGLSVWLLSFQGRSESKSTSFAQVNAFLFTRARNHFVVVCDRNWMLNTERHQLRRKYTDVFYLFQISLI